MRTLLIFLIAISFGSVSSAQTIVVEDTHLWL